MTEDAGSGWIGYAADDRHGRPAVEGNEHLSVEQRDDLERRASEVARSRGRHQAVVVVDVYENGEAVPQVQRLRVRIRRWVALTQGSVRCVRWFRRRRV